LIAKYRHCSYYFKADKIIKTLFYTVTVVIVAYLRLFFPGKALCENDAVLYTEIVKIIHGINPFPQFTFKWTPVFLTGYYGWILSDLRALLYFFLPFLKAQYYFTALFGIGVVFSTYRFVIRLYGDKKTAMLAAFLVSIIPIQVSMSYGLSAEIPQTLFLLESFNFLIDFINTDKKKYFFISGVFFVFSMLSKPLSALFIPGICFLIFINRTRIKGNIIRTILKYFILPILVWLSWAIPNFYRIFGDHAHSFSRFGFRIGSESMKIGFIEAHLQFLSAWGFFLLACSLVYLIWLRKKEDIFLSLSIGVSLLFLYSLKDVMTYWYPFIVPFYCVVISRAFFTIKFKAAKWIFFMLLVYFAGICIRTDIINVYFDFNSQAGFYMRPDSKYMVFPQVQCQVNLDTVKKLKELMKEDDIIFLSHTFGSYEGFLMHKDIYFLPIYRHIKKGGIEYEKDWAGKVNKTIDNILNNGKKGRVLIVLQDGGYYYRVYDKGVWFETHQDQLLEKAGFKKIYEIEYPDKNTIDKAKRYYSICSSQYQWAKNYIFTKEY